MHFWHAARRHQLCWVVSNYCRRSLFATTKSGRGWDPNSIKRGGLYMVMNSSEPSCSYSTYCVQHLYPQRLRELFGGNRKCFALAANSYRATGAVEELPKAVCRQNRTSLFQAWRRHRKRLTEIKRIPLLCTDCQWKPIIFMSLADNKGQVLKKTLAFLLGEPAYAQSSSAPANQLNGTWVPPTRSKYLKARPVAFLAQTAEVIMLVLRLCYLLALFTPALVLGLIVDTPESIIRQTWLDLLLSTLEHAGPAFIKWGQWAATRPDIFPVDVCEALSRLHMQCPAHSFAQTKKIILKAFRKPVEEIFEEFSEEPIASGSIAQVHRAILRVKDNEPQVVAVKVRHPHVSKVIQRDFVIMNWLAKLSTSIPGLKHLQLDKSVQQFATFMTKQVDLTLEAAHLLRFTYNFRKWKTVTFPTPIYPFVHPTVLVETFEEGDSIVKYVENRERTPIHKYLARLGTRILLKMLLEDNFVHGDLHPGNIFVRFKGKRPQVVLLDVGMVAELSPRNVMILLELFKAAACRDGRKVAECTLQFSEEQTCPDPEAFIRDVESKFKQYLAERGTALNTGECMTDLFDQVRRHRVNLDGDVCTVMVTTLILEGWQRKLDPDLDILTMLGQMLFEAEWLETLEYTLFAIAAP